MQLGLALSLTRQMDMRQRTMRSSRTVGDLPASAIGGQAAMAAWAEGLGRRRHHKHLAAKRVAAEDDDAEDEEDDELEHPDADHCDERCRALDELMDKFDNEPFDEDADDDEDA